MPLHTQQLLQLRDGQDRLLGQVVIEEVRGDLVCGRFVEGPDYPKVAHLFAAYREAVNQQLFSHVDDLEGAIAALGARLGSPDGAGMPAIHDVQVGAGRITFRLRTPAQDGQDGQGCVREAPANKPVSGTNFVP